MSKYWEEIDKCETCDGDGYVNRNNLNASTSTGIGVFGLCPECRACKHEWRVAIKQGYASISPPGDVIGEESEHWYYCIKCLKEIEQV